MDINVPFVVSLIWLVVPLVGYVRLSTVSTLVTLSLYIMWKFRQDWKGALYQTVVCVAFTTSLYEIIFNLVAACVFLRTMELFIEHLLILHYVMVGGWLILGFKQAVQNFAPTKISTVLFIAFLVGWVLWISIGFPYNVPSDVDLNLSGEILNVVTKALFLFGYALGLQPTHKK